MSAIGAALAMAGVATGAHAATKASKPAASAPAHAAHAAATPGFETPTTLHITPMTGNGQDATAAAAAALAFGDTGANASLHITPPRKTMQWDGKGRWGLKFDYQQPTSHGDQYQSFDAGTFYKFTPRLHISGTVGVSDPTDPRVPPVQQQPQPRVRLETTFKF